MKLSIENIGVILNKQKIIDKINIDIPSGEFVGIVGPNGSGKSTLLKSIYRIHKPHVGTMYLEGKELFKMSIKEAARNIGVVSQFDNLNFDFKVEEMVLMGRNPHKKVFQQNIEEDYAILHDALEKVGMKGKPYLNIEVDEHFSSVGVLTRVEAFVNSLKSEKINREEVLTLKQYSDGVVHRPTNIKTKLEEIDKATVLYLPHIYPYSHMLKP